MVENVVKSMPKSLICMIFAVSKTLDFVLNLNLNFLSTPQGSKRSWGNIHKSEAAPVRNGFRSSIAIPFLGGRCGTQDVFLAEYLQWCHRKRQRFNLAVRKRCDFYHPDDSEHRRLLLRTRTFSQSQKATRYHRELRRSEISTCSGNGQTATFTSCKRIISARFTRRGWTICSRIIEKVITCAGIRCVEYEPEGNFSGSR